MMSNTDPVKTLDSILTVAGSRRRFLVLIASFIVGFMEIGSVGSLVAIVDVCSGSLISHPLGCEASLLLGGTIIVIITLLRVGFSIFYKHYCVEISKSIDLMLFKRIQLNYKLGEDLPSAEPLSCSCANLVSLLNILIPSVRLFMAVGGIVSIIVALVVVQNSEVFYVFAFIGFIMIL